MHPFIRELQDLQDERTDLLDAHEEAPTDETAADLQAFDDEHGERLRYLTKIDEEGRDTIADWPDCHLFTDPEKEMQQLAEDAGWLSDDNPLLRYVDWQAFWEREARFDYSEIEIDGVTYYGRSN